MHRCFLALPLLAAVLLTGCGTAYYNMPPRTLQKDEMSYGVGVAWSSLEPWRDWNGVAVNGHVWWGMSDRDAMGLGFSHIDLPIFFPDFSYAHSWAPDAEGRRLVGSLHTTLALLWNPGLEAGLGVSHERGDFAQLAWAGAGLWRNGTITPSLRYVAQHGELRGEVGWMPGRTATALRVTRGMYFTREDSVGVVLTREEVVTVELDPALSWRGYEAWVVTLADGGRFEISNRDPYTDSWFEDSRRGFIEKFPSEPGTRLWWVYERYADGRPQREFPFPAELDMDHLVAQFERDGVLRLRQDPAAIEQAVERHDQWWRDLTAGLWWAWYDPRD
jgi:hypothetical protein